MPRTKSNEVEFEAVKDLIRRATLQEIDFHEVSARKTGESRQDEPNEDNVDVSMHLQHHVDGNSFGILFSVKLLMFRGEVDVAAAAEYTVDDAEPIDPHTVKAFGNEVAVMTLLPYVRETISTLTTKMWTRPFLLPTLERGFVGFDLDEGEPES